MYKVSSLSNLLISTVFIAFCSCRTNPEINTENVFEKVSINDSLSYYFPSVLNDTFDRGSPDFQDFAQKWYSSSLYSFKEPILYLKSDSQTIYRLLWLRSFHEPVCFTMKEHNGQYFFNAKVLDRQPSFYLSISQSSDEKGNTIVDTLEKADRLAYVSFDTLQVLTKAEWKQIESHLDKLNFWAGPIKDPNGSGGTDGANWIIEGRKDNKYHFIERRNNNRELEPFGKYLIKLSGLQIKDNEIY